MGHIFILVIILIFISYFVLNLYEKFQTKKNIKNICFYQDFHKVFYRNKNDNTPVNEYLRLCPKTEIDLKTIYSLYRKYISDRGGG
jgi:hypothetical protein